MSVLRRRGRRQDPADPTAGLDLHAVAEAVLDAAEAALGARPALASGPEPVLGYGPDTYRFELAGVEGPWAGSLLARTSEPEVVRREARWIRTAHRHGYPTPEVLAGPGEAAGPVPAPGNGDGEGDADADASGDLLVFRQPPGENLAATMVAHLTSMPTLLRSFGELHARLHALPVPGADESPNHVAPLDQLAGWAEPEPVRAAVERELAWLDAHRPPPVDEPVICHSELIAVYVYLDGPDPATAVPVNWTRSGLGDPAYDVAAALLAFWSVPIYVDNALHRRGLKMARDSLCSTYQTGYLEGGGRPLDEPRLRYWQAYQAATLATDLARRLHGVSSPWERGTIVPEPESALDEVRERFWELAED
jgi:aminoglycoside phosphotransferase (APT) family kinase protein